MRSIQELKDAVDNIYKQYLQHHDQDKSIDELKAIDQEFIPHLHNLHGASSSEGFIDLANVFDTAAHLHVILGRITGNLKHYTDASVFYNYVISIINEKLKSSSTDVAYSQMVEEIYTKLASIRASILDTIHTAHTAGAPATPENAYTDTGIGATKSITVEIDKHKDVLKNLREHTKTQLEEIERYRLRSQAAEDAKEKTEWQELYVEDMRLLFEYIAKALKGFLSGLYQKTEAELQQVGILKPCDYAVMGLGSLALNQATPYSDLEFAILLEHEGESKEEGDSIKEYFRNLTHLVHFKVINLGETIIPTSKYGLDLSHLVHRGVNFDLGGKTPLGRIEGDKPYELIKTIQWMMHYVKNEEVDSKKPEHIDKNLPFILENVCFIHGDQGLVRDYKQEVTSFLHGKVAEDDLQSPLNCEARAIKILKDGVTEIEYTNITTESLSLVQSHKSGDLEMLSPLVREEGKLFDVKQEIYRLPDRLLYNLGLYYRIQGDSAWDTVDKLSEQKLISLEAETHLKGAVAFACMLRLKTYIHNNGQKENISLFSVQSEEQQKETTSKIFHLSKDDLEEHGGLFEYFYTTLSLHKKLYEFCVEHDALERDQKQNFFQNNNFYSNDLANKGLIYYRLLQYGKAQSNLEEAVGSGSLENQYLLDARNVLGCIYADFKLGKKAIDQWQHCLTHPLVPEGSLIYAMILHNLGQAYLLECKYEEAEQYCQHGLEIRQATYKEVLHADIADSLFALGNIRAARSAYVDALEYYNKALAIQKQIYYIHPAIANSYNSIGNIYRDKSEYTLAQQCYANSLQIWQNIYKDEPNISVAYALNNLGDCYRAKGEYDKAIEYYNQSLNIKNLIHIDILHPSFAYTFNNLGVVYEAKKEHGKAIAYLTRALEIRKVTYKDEMHSDVATSYNNIGAIYISTREFDKAIQYCQRALEIREFIYKRGSHPDIADSLSNLGTAHRGMHNYDKAIAYCSKALQTILMFTNHPSQHVISQEFGTAVFKFAEHHHFNPQSIVSTIHDCFKQKVDFTDYTTHYKTALSLQQEGVSKLIETIESYRLALIFTPEVAEDVQTEIYHNLSKITEIDQQNILLWLAIWDCNVEKAKECMLSEIVDSNVAIQGLTPLVQAVINCSKDMILALILGKANINKPTSEGVTPLYCSLGYYNQPINLKIVELLLQNGADSNIPMNDGDTPMHMAHYRANIDAIKLLLQYGANLNTQNHAGKTPLHCLLEKTDISVEDKIKIIEEFLPKYNLALQDQEGKTVIDYAAEHCPESLSALLQDIPSNQGNVDQVFIVDAEEIDLALAEEYMLIGYLCSDYYNSYLGY